MFSNTTIPSIILNEQKTYEGDLAHYFRAIMQHATHLFNPYHNYRHGFHVMWLCHEALWYYAGLQIIPPLQCRVLMLAAMLHDVDHRGRSGNDDLNIELAIRFFQKHCLPEDEPVKQEVIHLIRSSQYPYVVPSEKLTILGKILRDADAAQALSSAWVQQIIFGLSAEMGVTPKKVFQMQQEFLGNLQFQTDWARKMFSSATINAKIAESRAYLEILEG